MKNIALISMSAKPFHIGHFKLIQIASNENDIVELFVSTSDRRRKNEISVLGNTMLKIWILYIEKIMPSNVKIHYVSAPDTPVRKIYEYLGIENDLKSQDKSFTLYGTGEDLFNNFSIKSLQKYFDFLFSNHFIKCEPISKDQTVQISGTEMRLFLQNDLKTQFIENLPEELEIEDCNQIWNLLKTNAIITTKYNTSPKKLFKLKNGF